MSILRRWSCCGAAPGNLGPILPKNAKRLCGKGKGLVKPVAACPLQGYRPYLKGLPRPPNSGAGARDSKGNGKDRFKGNLGRLTSPQTRNPARATCGTGSYRLSPRHARRTCVAWCHCGMAASFRRTGTLCLAGERSHHAGSGCVTELCRARTHFAA